MSTETKANNGPTGTVWQPNDEQRAVLEALQAECAKEKTTVDFARKFLPFGRSLFDQMMDALDPKRVNAQGERLPSYWDKISPETVAVKFEFCLPPGRASGKIGLTEAVDFGYLNHS